MFAAKRAVVSRVPSCCSIPHVINVLHLLLFYHPPMSHTMPLHSNPSRTQIRDSHSIAIVSPSCGTLTKSTALTHISNSVCITASCMNDDAHQHDWPSSSSKRNTPSHATSVLLSAKIRLPGCSQTYACGAVFWGAAKTNPTTQRRAPASNAHELPPPYLT